MQYLRVLRDWEEGLSGPAPAVLAPLDVGERSRGLAVTLPLTPLAMVTLRAGEVGKGGRSAHSAAKTAAAYNMKN